MLDRCIFCHLECRPKTCVHLPVLSVHLCAQAGQGLPVGISICSLHVALEPFWRFLWLQMPQKYLSYPAVCKACCALLRQLANSDSIRTELVERGALNILQTVVHAHLEKAGTLEQALGLLTALLLRSPSAAEKAVECGCGDTVLEVSCALSAWPCSSALQHHLSWTSARASRAAAPYMKAWQP